MILAVVRLLATVLADIFIGGIVAFILAILTFAMIVRDWRQVNDGEMFPAHAGRGRH